MTILDLWEGETEQIPSKWGCEARRREHSMQRQGGEDVNENVNFSVLAEDAEPSNGNIQS